jgi:hypothetical protein
MKKYSRFIISGLVGLVLVGAILISESIQSNKSVPLKDYAVEITIARLAASKNALDGTGEFREVHCRYLGKLAKEYDSKSDFLNCSSPNLIYLASPDTAINNVLTLSDDNYTAKFTVDKEFKTLTNYEFINVASPGFNKFGGR